MNKSRFRPTGKGRRSGCVKYQNLFIMDSFKGYQQSRDGIVDQITDGVYIELYPIGIESEYCGR